MPSHLLIIIKKAYNSKQSSLVWKYHSICEVCATLPSSLLSFFCCFRQPDTLPDHPPLVVYPANVFDFRLRGMWLMRVPLGSSPKKSHKKTFQAGGPQSPFSISSSFILLFAVLFFFLGSKQKYLLSIQWPGRQKNCNTGSCRAFLRQDPLDLSFWSFLTFLHHGIEEVKGHLLWKFYKNIRRKSWSNVPPKLLACIGFLYKVVHKIGRLRKFNRSRGI